MPVRSTARFKIYRDPRGAFWREEDGALSVFALFLFILMVLVGGIGVDVMHNEMRRTQMQSALDRAVLAAANTPDEVDPRVVVRDYMRAAGLEDGLSNIEVLDGSATRTVGAIASGTSPTSIMSSLGINSLPVAVRSEAIRGLNNIEISVVLDISGSMERGTRMTNLKIAAEDFIDTVLDPEHDGKVSVSLVQYAAAVNAGPVIFSQLRTTNEHEYSYCVQFRDEHFSTTRLDFSTEYRQYQHFSRRPDDTSSPISKPDCPDREEEQIVAHSKNRALLNDRIRNLRPGATTSIFQGMKWGVALLDPSTQRLTTALVRSGDVVSQFRNRPVAYTTPGTEKHIILMTDGSNVTQEYVRDEHYETEEDRELWARIHLRQIMRSYGGTVSTYLERIRWPTEGDAVLDDICTAAKEQGIVVWTVGFEIGGRSARVMESCASSSATFFEVSGAELIEAFAEIADQLTSVRLTR